jgi:hypothetical protein
MMPLETAWHITVEWKASDAACRTLMFFRAFGFYLSSFVLIAISLDRYFAIAHPMSIMDASRRAKIMLIFAWLCSIIASIPQVRLPRTCLFVAILECNVYFVTGITKKDVQAMPGNKDTLIFTAFDVWTRLMIFSHGLIGGLVICMYFLDDA